MSTEANATRSEAARGNQNAAKDRPKNSEHTNSVRTVSRPSTNAGARLAAELSGTNRGAVQRAAKAQPRTEDGRRLAPKSGSGTNSATTRPQADRHAGARAAARCHVCHGRRLILAWDEATFGCRLVRCPGCSGTEPPSATPRRVPQSLEAISWKVAA